MEKRIIYIVLILIQLLFITGCKSTVDHFRDSYWVDPLLKEEDCGNSLLVRDDDACRLDFSAGEMKSAYDAAKNGSTIERNRILYTAILASDRICEEHKAKVLATNALGNAVLGFGSTTLSSLAAIIGGASTKAGLSTAAAIFSGTRAEITSEFYKGQLSEAIVNQIQENRRQARSKLENQMKHPVVGSSNMLESTEIIALRKKLNDDITKWLKMKPVNDVLNEKVNKIRINKINNSTLKLTFPSEMASDNKKLAKKLILLISDQSFITKYSAAGFLHNLPDTNENDLAEFKTKEFILKNTDHPKTFALFDLAYSTASDFEAVQKSIQESDSRIASVSNMFSSTTAGYGIDQGMRDVAHYHWQCSFYQGVVSLTRVASQKRPPTSVELDTTIDSLKAQVEYLKSNNNEQRNDGLINLLLTRIAELELRKIEAE